MSQNKKPSPVKKPLTVKIPLEFPFSWGEGGLVEEIELKRPKGKHIKKLGKDVLMESLLIVAAKVCVGDFTPAFFDEMDAADCITVTEVIGDFLEGGSKTGKTASA